MLKPEWSVSPNARMKTYIARERESEENPVVPTSAHRCALSLLLYIYIITKETKTGDISKKIF